MTRILGLFKTLPRRIEFIDHMKPRKFFLLAVSLILLLLLFNCFFASLFYGYDIITGSDELRFFNKGKGLVSGDVDLYHLWNQPNAIDVYPPGYPLIVAELLTMIPGIDPFDVEHIYQVIFFLIAITLYFWLGLFFSRKMAIAAIIIRSCLFVVMVSRDTYYTYLTPYNYANGGGNYTEIAILLTLIFLFRFLNHIGSDRTNLALIFLAGVLHGLTHISGFTSFTVFISIFLVIYAAILSAREYPKHKPSFSNLHRRLLNYLWAVFNNRVMMPVYTTIMLPLAIFMLFYLELIIEVSSNTYFIDDLLPLPISIEMYVAMMCTLAFVGVLGLFIGGRKVPLVKIMPTLAPSIRIWQVLIMMYIGSFLLTIYLVNDNPNKYAYAIYAVISGFPSYIPGLTDGLVPILTVLAGTLMFILSVIGLIGLGYKGKPNETLLALLYLASYFFFVATFVFDVLIPHRSMFFLITLSLVVAMVTVDLPRSLWNLRNLIGLPFGRVTKKTLRLIRNHSRAIEVIILVGFLATAMIARANLEPIVRDYNESKNFLQFGSDVSPPLATIGLIEKVQEVAIPGESVLCAPDTLTALYTFVDINPSSSPTWNILLPDNFNFSEVFVSMAYYNDNSPLKWLTEHNGTLLILGMMDVMEGSKRYGYYQFDTAKFDNDPNLVKIYENTFGELIYRLNVTA